jgi:RND family efflux transporter MFP subunit
MTLAPDAPPTQPTKRKGSIPLVITLVTASIILIGVALATRASQRQNHTTLAQTPKFVGTTEARTTLYQAEHRYVGSVLAWNEAKLGPQFLSGYVTEVRVRAGDRVHRGQPLAIIEPELAKDRNLASRKQAEAINARLGFLARESERIQGLEKKGIVSENESENKLAEVQSEKAKLEAAQAQMASSDVEYQDTIQRAPFDGEIGERFLDPGAFVRPGNYIVSVVDRTRVICATDAPEQDHPFLQVGRAVHLRLLATGTELDGKIARVSPSADPSTRTLHFEVDLDNKDLAIPVGTSVEMMIKESAGQNVIHLPSAAAKVEGTRATLFVLEGDRARKKVLKFLGEREGELYLSPDLPPGAQVVVDGREQLEDGDQVTLKSVTPAGVRP